MTRDPRTNPQPGDEVRNGATIRRVIKRDTENLLIEGWGQRYRIKLKTWQGWCEDRRAEVAASADRR